MNWKNVQRPSRTASQQINSHPPGGREIGQNNPAPGPSSLAPPPQTPVRWPAGGPPSVLDASDLGTTLGPERCSIPQGGGAVAQRLKYLGRLEKGLTPCVPGLNRVPGKCKTQNCNCQLQTAPAITQNVDFLTRPLFWPALFRSIFASLVLLHSKKKAKAKKSATVHPPETMKPRRRHPGWDCNGMEVEARPEGGHERRAQGPRKETEMGSWGKAPRPKAAQGWFWKYSGWTRPKNQKQADTTVQGSPY